MISGRILVVDDEKQIHRFLAPALTAAGYEPLRAERGDEALRQVASAAPDLVLLDLGLPDMDGQEVLRKLREFSSVPVIILSARDQEAGKIAALDSGADDYVEKPFALGELLARIRTALRRKGQAQLAMHELTLGGLRLDTTAAKAELNGVPLGLTKREHALLLLLLRNHGRVLTHRQILTALWGPAHTEDVAYLRVYIGQLRRKLGEELSAKLKTEPGVGYRLEE
ncbi:MAG: response regulator transcription factor [Rhodospirillales bacterium]|nr:response regulator transcription factor [Rhodospirillales bacterium]